MLLCIEGSKVKWSVCGRAPCWGREEYGIECCDSSSEVDEREGIEFDDEEATSVDLEVLCRLSPKDEASVLIDEFMVLANLKEESTIERKMTKE